MKKTFLTGFKAFCVSAVALFAVSSCYDDTDLREQIQDVNEQVTGLAQKIAELENKLTNDVAGLNAAIAAAESSLEEKIAVVNVEKTNDVITLTLANGEKIQVSAPVEQVELDPNANNTGLITTVTENGKTYWAVVKNDGSKENLGVEVGHPDVKLSFKVNPETNELLVSYDGVDFSSTGVLVKDPETYNHILTGFEEGEDFVTLKIGDKSYTLPKYGEASASLVLGRTDFFLRYGASKNVTLTAEGIDEYYVMSKPDGWKATVDGTTLTVTAPEMKVVEAGAYEQSGLILVHATTAEGKCKVAKLEVSTGKGLTLDVDNQGNIKIENSYTQETVDSWTGEKMFGFANFYMGFATPEVFLENPKAYIDTYKNEWSFPNWDSYGMFYNQWDLEFLPYVEGEYETDILNTNVNNVSNWLTYSDLPYGSTYVIWVAPQDEEGFPIADAVEYITYTHVLTEVEIAEISQYEVTLNIKAQGATRFFVGMTDASFEQYGATLETYMNEGGTWGAIVNGYVDYVGDYVLEDGEYAGENAFQLSIANYGEPLAFNTKYYFWVFPYIEGTEYKDYKTQFEPYVFEVTTAQLAEGGQPAELTLDYATYTELSVLVSPAEGTKSVYYYFYEPSVFNDFASDEELISDVVANCYWGLEYEDYVSTNLDPDQASVLVAVSAMEDGTYGIEYKTFNTLALPTEVDETLTLDYVIGEKAFTEISTELVYEEGTSVYWKFFTETMLNNYADDAAIAENVLLNGKNDANPYQGYLSAGESRTLCTVVVKDGKYKLFKKNFLTKNYPYNENITVALDGNMTFANRTCTATFNVEGADKVAVWCSYSGSQNNFITNVVNNAAKGSYSNYKFLDVVDGKVTATFTNVYGDYMVVYATAYKVEGGAVTALAAETQALTIANYLE